MSEELEPKNSVVPSALAVHLDALARNFRNWASRRFPSLIDSSNIKRSREYYRQRDLELIPASIPAATQHVALKRVFAAEFYTPAHAERLFQAFEKLGWHSAATSSFHRNSAEWVARSRRASEGGGWINLGAIVRPGSHQRFRDAAEVELPNGFEDAHAELFSISSSLSCIVVTFNAAREVEDRYEQIAGASLGTELPRTKRGYSIIDPKSRKRRAIAEARDGFRRDILSWFKANVPGAFAASGNLELLPTCELLFLDGIRTQEDPASRNLWLDYLGLDYGGENWASTSLPGLRFSHPVSHVDSQKGHAVLSVERHDLRAIDNTMYGGDDDRAYLNMLSVDLPGWVCQWAIPALLRLYREELNVVRDSRSFTGQSENATSVLKRLRRVTSNSIDISLLAAELPGALQFPISDGWDFFLEAEKKEAISLGSALNRRSTDLVDQLAISDRAIRDLLLQQGNLVNALEAIQTQRTMSRLTVVMTVLTIAILILTAVMAVPILLPQAPEQPAKNAEHGAQ
ncbi:hypothetical protein FJ414_28280 [Mesorhizobium sp. B3-1-6]|uniref:hypothetical protein n=1 Tax=Mesorhizobium sp. B3-1-6 TaxID=2589895 RepID=UPI0011295196|nr:hypothetical protein [Mesorhizobium sp. B3-1-6]TPI27885.1 hypothetical protein FJ414_28280 [Mesorhizobium sp. B3-1-6]